MTLGAEETRQSPPTCSWALPRRLWKGNPCPHSCLSECLLHSGLLAIATLFPPPPVVLYPRPGPTCRTVPACPSHTLLDPQTKTKASVSSDEPPVSLRKPGGPSGPGHTYLDCLLPDGGVGVQETVYHVGEDLGVDRGPVEVLDELLHLRHGSGHENMVRPSTAPQSQGPPLAWFLYPGTGWPGSLLSPPPCLWSQAHMEWRGCWGRAKGLRRARDWVLSRRNGHTPSRSLQTFSIKRV